MPHQLPSPQLLMTPKGKAWAVATLRYGRDLLWLTFLQDSGECWMFSHNEIRNNAPTLIGAQNSRTLCVSRFPNATNDNQLPRAPLRHAGA